MNSSSERRDDRDKRQSAAHEPLDMMAEPIRQSQVKVWDEGASSYDETRQNDPVYSSCVHQAISCLPDGVRLCLDAGAGTGIPTAQLAPRCDLVVAVDYSFDSLRILAQKKLPNVLLVQADLQALPFKESVFDACVSINTLQHLNPRGPQQRAMRELKRVTKAFGILCLSVHHYSKDKRKSGWIKEGRPGQPGIDYIFRFSRQDLLGIMPDAKVRGVGYYGVSRLPYLGSRLQNMLGRLFGGIAGRLGHGHMLTASMRKGPQQQSP